MASKQAHKRLTKEYLGVQKNPIPFIVAKPKEDNILEWYVTTYVHLLQMGGKRTA
jgi:ubiquitin-conjugating enzyme E2 J2